MDMVETELVALPGGPARVQWRRSLRARRVSLRVDPRGGDIVITLPPRAARKAGMALLIDNEAWLRARLAALPRAVVLRDGADLALHGRAHRIRHLPQAHGGAWLCEGEIHVAGHADFLARRVTDFLREQAKLSFSALVAEKTARAGVVAGRVTVKDTSTRWGSCAANRNLAFSWRLVMAPPWVQDYVVAHEVAHLRHMNHGPAFWALVDQLTINTRPAMAWLRTEGAGLLRVG